MSNTLTGIEDLDIEIMVILPIRDLRSLKRCSHALNKLFVDQHLWYKRLLVEFGVGSVSKPVNMSFQSRYFSLMHDKLKKKSEETYEKYINHFRAGYQPMTDMYNDKTCREILRKINNESNQFIEYFIDHIIKKSNWNEISCFSYREPFNLHRLLKLVLDRYNSALPISKDSRDNIVAKSMYNLHLTQYFMIKQLVKYAYLLEEPELNIMRRQLKFIFDDFPKNPSYVFYAISKVPQFRNMLQPKDIDLYLKYTSNWHVSLEALNILPYYFDKHPEMLLRTIPYLGNSQGMLREKAMQIISQVNINTVIQTIAKHQDVFRISSTKGRFILSMLAMKITHHSECSTIIYKFIKNREKDFTDDELNACLAHSIPKMDTWFTYKLTKNLVKDLRATSLETVYMAYRSLRELNYISSLSQNDLEGISHKHKHTHKLYIKENLFSLWGNHKIFDLSKVPMEGAGSINLYCHKTYNDKLTDPSTLYRIISCFIHDISYYIVCLEYRGSPLFIDAYTFMRNKGVHPITEKPLSPSKKSKCIFYVLSPYDDQFRKFCTFKEFTTRPSGFGLQMIIKASFSFHIRINPSKYYKKIIKKESENIGPVRYWYARSLEGNHNIYAPDIDMEAADKWYRLSASLGYQKAISVIEDKEMDGVLCLLFSSDA